MGAVVKPMLATLARSLPVGPEWVYEPKFDGFRCLAVVEGGAGGVDLWSRNQRPLARYFPEVVSALSALGVAGFVVDGELVGSDFASLMGRLHPAASRVDRLSRESPACFVGFDVLEVDGSSLLDVPFVERRRRLESLLPAEMVTPCTDSVEAARAWLESPPPGIDGVVAKRVDGCYEPGRRAMVKVKRERTVDCVVAGFRWALDRPVVASLLLGLYDVGGALRHVGVCASFAEARRRELVDELRPLATELEGHPWAGGFLMGGNPMGRLAGSAATWTPDMELDWVPLRPSLVAEVAFTQLDVDRFRYPAVFVRWRPDRDASTCTFSQLESAA